MTCGQPGAPAVQINAPLYGTVFTQEALSGRPRLLKVEMKTTLMAGET